MQYSNYLYFKPIELNESNLYILNEMYFGKTPRIKLLEKLVQLYIDSFNKEISEDDLKPFYRVIKKGNSKFLFKNNVTKYTYSDHFEWITNNMTIKIIKLMQDLISIIFGIASVKITFNTKFDNRFNMAINHNFSNKDKIRYNNEILEILDINNKWIDYNYIKQNIMVTNSGISLNMTKCPLQIKLFFSKVMHLQVTASEIVSAILHEIGHFFSYLILPINKYLLNNFTIQEKNKYLSYKEIDKCFQYIKDNKELFEISEKELKDISKSSIKNKENTLYKIAKRTNEKFADQFVSLYGYGPHASTEFLNLSKNNIYLKYSSSKYNNKRENYIDEIIDKDSDFEAIVRNSNINNLDEHPIKINRIQSQILQLQAELKNPRLSLFKKKQIEEDIKNIRQQLHDYNSILKYTSNINLNDEEILNQILFEMFLKDIESLKTENQEFAIKSKNCENNIKNYENDINNLLKEKEEIFNDTEKLRKKIEDVKWDLNYDWDMDDDTDAYPIEFINKEYNDKIKKFKDLISEEEHNILRFNDTIKENNKKIKQLEKERKEFLNDKKQLQIKIEEKRKEIISHNKNLILTHKKGMKDLRSKDTKNYMYEKDSYIDPYDISTEINKLYDNTKLRHINTIFNNDTWLNIKAQKLFEDILNNCIKHNRVLSDDIMTFIEEKYKYHMEKPFFNHKKIREEIVKIFAQEQRIIENKLNEFIKNKFNLNNKSQLDMLLKVIEEDNLNKNMKKLKQALFGRKNNN